MWSTLFLIWFVCWYLMELKVNDKMKTISTNKNRTFFFCRWFIASWIPILTKKKEEDRHWKNTDAIHTNLTKNWSQNQNHVLVIQSRRTIAKNAFTIKKKTKHGKENWTVKNIPLWLYFTSSSYCMHNFISVSSSRSESFVFERVIESFELFRWLNTQLRFTSHEMRL